MNIFDLHSDTLFEIDSKGCDLYENNLSVSLSSMQKYARFVRFFAIFTPDTLKGQDAQYHFDRLYSAYTLQTDKYKDIISRITTKTELENSKIASILSVENASVLNGKLKNIEKLKKLGVKLMSLTWNGENELGYGQLNNKRLKAFGIEAVKELEKNGIIIDVSHLSDKGFKDVLRYTKKPFIASHSNSRAVCNNKRNLTDEQIKEIIKRKGLIGLNFYKNFLKLKGEKASKEDIICHANHIMSLGGQDVLSLGTDFDGAEVVSEFSDDSKLFNLFELFVENGYSMDQTKKILFENAYNFFLNNL